MSSRNKPPFRADQVGSLLRTPQSRRPARTGRRTRITAGELKATEDREIEKLIRKQEAIGLQAVTDGEFRRSWWHFDFFGMLEGVELRDAASGIQFQGVQTKAQAPHIVGTLGFPDDHPMLEHFRFLRAHARALPKMTIPSPNVLHFRAAYVDPKLYPDREALFAALGATWRQAVQGILRRGLPVFAVRRYRLGIFVFGRRSRTRATARHRCERICHRLLPDSSMRCLEAKPADMTITTHVCRGNFRSTWITSGGYEPVAEALLGACNYDGYFLEYDSDRAGGFEPLRFLPQRRETGRPGSGHHENRSAGISGCH